MNTQHTQAVNLASRQILEERAAYRALQAQVRMLREERDQALREREAANALVDLYIARAKKAEGRG